ncbi:ATP-binding protein [Ramlibacter sp. AN1015]|uniref:ATP-binding protein n=1 Tax=Ramlibacter sp. AN1015 TaxID=3133428 RepID=UPI0030C2357F
MAAPPSAPSRATPPASADSAAPGIAGGNADTDTTADWQHSEFAATLESISGATARLRRILPSALPAQARDAVELGVAEALSNVVRHGYDPDAAGRIALSWRLRRDGAFEVLVQDWGRPVPPGCLEEGCGPPFAFDPHRIAALPEGGMGVALIRLSFDEVEYRRVGDRNDLRLLRRSER